MNVTLLFSREQYQAASEAYLRGIERLLWASMASKDPEISDIFYVKELAAPFTVNTMIEPENIAPPALRSTGSDSPVNADCPPALCHRLRDARLRVHSA